MQNKCNRKVNPDTFWFWLANKAGVSDKFILSTNKGAWMGWPDETGSEIIIPVYDKITTDLGGPHKCGRISFRFSEVNNEQFEIDTRISGPEYISDYYRKELLPKIDTLWPVQPSLGRANPQRNHLNKEQIIYCKKIVRQAKKMRVDTGKRWKEIAKELDIPETTLRGWRHKY